MKIISKIINVLDNIITFIIIILFICAITFAGYAIYDTYYIYNNAELGQEILKLKPNRENGFTISGLQQINPDICGWITINNTNIDYPIVIGKDNFEYLNKDYKKDFAATGSIFLDYRSDRDFNDNYSVIYGHNMNASKMFSDLKKFGNKSYFEKNQFGVLYTSLCVYDINILCYKKVNAFCETTYNIKTYKNDRNMELVSFFEKDAINKNDIEVSAEDKLITLSTCDTSGGNDRSILVAKLTKSELSGKIDSNQNTKEETKKENKSIIQKIDVKKFLKNIVIIFIIIIFIILLVKRKLKNTKKNSKK